MELYLLTTLRYVKFRNTTLGAHYEAEGVDKFNKCRELLGTAKKKYTQKTFDKMLDQKTIDLDSRRLVGVFTDKAEAVKVVENNLCDICECNYYRYAVIETLEPGMYPIPSKEDWYEIWEDKCGVSDGDDGIKVASYTYNSKKIRKPKELAYTCCFY